MVDQPTRAPLQDQPTAATPFPAQPLRNDSAVEAPPFSADFLNRYQMVRFLGRGAMGAVYLMRQVNLNRLVAVKILATSLFTREEVERFEREARILAQFDHEHIVTVHDVGCDGRLPYMVCTYVEGETLSDRIRRPPELSLSRCLRYAAQILAGLREAHKAGVIHRDLKPGNIFLSSEGKLKIGDFGLAKGLAQPSGTVAGTVMGTPAYMSPEQCRGEAVSERSDLYALGVILFEMVTGQLPFKGPQLVDFLRQHTYDEPPSPRSKRPELPAALEGILARALKKDPNARYSKANEFRKELKELEKTLEGSRSEIVVVQAEGADDAPTRATVPPPGSIPSIDSITPGSSPVTPMNSNRLVPFLLGTSVIAAAIAGGFWLRDHSRQQTAAMPTPSPVQVAALQTPAASVTTPAPAEINHLEKARALNSKRQTTEAIAVLKSALQTNPKDIALHLYLGHLLRNTRQLGPSREAYETAIRLEPVNGQAHAGLAFTCQASTLYKEAEEHFREAIRLGHRTEEVTNGYGFLLLRQRRYTEAEPQFLEAIRRNPRFVPARQNLASLYQDQGRQAEQEGQLRAILDQDPSYIQVRNRLIVLYLTSNRLDEAQKECEEARVKTPNDALIGVYLAEIAEKRNHPQLAERQSHRRLADVLMRQNRLPEAIPLLEKVIRMGPAEDRDYLALATAYRETHQLREAEMLLLQALRVRDIAPFHRALARIFLAQNRPMEARRELERVAILNPTDKEAQQWLSNMRRRPPPPLRRPR